MPTKYVLKRKTKRESKSKRKRKPKSDYESCKSKEMNRLMKLYERGNLIIRGRKINNRKQAIAIALQQSDSKCTSKINGIDIKNMESKVQNAQISSFTYSDIKRILFLYQYYLKKKNKGASKALSLQTKIIQYLLTNELKSSYRKLLVSTFLQKK